MTQRMKSMNHLIEDSQKFVFEKFIIIWENSHDCALSMFLALKHFQLFFTVNSVFFFRQINSEKEKHEETIGTLKKEKEEVNVNN